jgi:hypothetical protein
MRSATASAMGAPDPSSVYTADSRTRQAWQRHLARKKRTHGASGALDNLVAKSLTVSIVGVASATAILTAAALLLVAEVATGSAWGWLLGWLAAGAGLSLALALAPLPIGAAQAALSLYSWVSLNAEVLRAVRQVRRAPTIPLRDVLWAIYSTNVPLLSQRGAPYDYLRMAGRTGRAIAARYGPHALPGGKLHDLALEPPGLRHPLLLAWSGSAEAFLQMSEPIDGRTWRTLLEIVQRTGGQAGRVPQQGWTENLLNELSCAEVDDDQLDVMLALATGWQSDLAALVRTARTL